MDQTQRLDKYLANLGVCSRRAVKDFLYNKIVSINGKRVTEPGIRINPSIDVLRIDGAKIKQPTLKYYLLNKPKGYISTTTDERNRKNVVSLIKSDERIYPVGRLDKDTTGLLILTNDGKFTNLLTHPRYHVSKTYSLTISGKVNENQLRNLQDGVKLEDGITYPAEVTIKNESTNSTILEIKIHEGRNRQIRRMCSAVGINLVDLERIAIGTLKDNSLEKGEYRELTPSEIKLLTKVA